jgi:hypothetical protein
VHADVRVDNVLFDDQHSAILCDFSAASPCGQPNPVFPDLPLPVSLTQDFSSNRLGDGAQAIPLEMTA